MRRAIQAGAVVYAVMLVCALVYLAPKLHRSRVIGWTAERSRATTAETWTGLQPGDRILAFNGDTRIQSAGVRTYVLNYPADQPYRIRVERGAETFDVTLRITTVENWAVARGSTLLWVGMLCTIMSTWIGWQDPESRMVRITWAAGMLIGLQEMRIGTEAAIANGWPTSFLYIVLVWLNPWSLYAHYRFAAALPTGEPEQGRWLILQRVLFVVALLLAFQAVPYDLASLALPGEAGIRLAQVAVKLQPPPLPLWGIAELLYFPSTIAVMVRNYRRAESLDARRRIRWVVLSIVLSWGALAVAALLAGLRIVPATAVDTTGYLLILVPITLAYAIVRHRVLGVRVVVRRGLQYLLARHSLEAAMLAVPLIVVARAVLHPELPVAELARPPLPYACVFAATAMLLATRRRLLAALDRRFFREEWDAEQVLAGLPELIRRQSSFVETMEIVRQRIGGALHPEFVETIYRPRRHDLLQTSAGEPIPAEWQFPSAVAAEGSLLLSRKRQRDWSPEENEWLRENRVELLIAIPSRERGGGVLLLGAKRSEEPYTAPEVEMLIAIADHLGLAQENQHLVLERAEAVVAERTRIARELHDTLAQGFAGISLHLETARAAVRESPEHAAAHLDQARQLARASLAEARRSVHDLRESGGRPADLGRQLHDLAGRISTGTSVRIHVATAGEAPLPEPVGSNLFRIAQESITNALRHSGADRIDVALEFDAGTVRLRVRDNGRGFDHARGGQQGYGLTGMRERVAEMKGRLEVRSAAGEGTEICAVAEYR